MSIIKYKIPKSVVTNIDTADAGIQVAAELMNMKSERGYLEGKVAEWDSTGGFPNPSGYELETGIYAYISTDQYSIDIKAIKVYKVLVLVYVIQQASRYKRKVYYQEDGGIWVDVETRCTDWAQEFTPTTEDKFTEAYLTSEIDGKTLLMNEDGVVKIYMPHDSFWLGRLKRSIDVNDDTERLEIPEEYYFEKLVEDVDLKTGMVGNMTYEDYNLARTTARLGILAGFETNPDDAVGSGPVVTFTQIAAGKPLFYESDQDKWFLTISYTLKDADNIPIPCPLEATRYGGGSKWWGFRPEYTGNIDEPGTTTGDLFFPLEIKNYLTPGDGWDAITTERKVRPITTAKVHNQDGLCTWLNAWEEEEFVLEMASTEIAAQTWYYTGNAVADAEIGWSAQQIAFVITCMLDYKTEIMLQHHAYTPAANRANTDYSVGITLNLPDNINKRITNIKVYAKELFAGINNLDYEEVKSFDLQAPEESTTPVYKKFSVWSASLTGRTLYNATNFLLENKRLENYRIINKIEDRAIARGFAICISNEYRVTPFHCGIGNGQIMTDLFYLSTAILTAFEGTIVALESTESKLFAITERSTYLVHVTDINGYPAFSVLEQLEYGIRFRHDAIKVQGGVVLYTLDGIFLINGQQSQLVSSDINDVLEDDYATRDDGQPSIFYNSYQHQLYYIPQYYKPIDYIFNRVREYGFLYNFKRGGWETVNLDAVDMYGDISVTSPSFITWQETSERYFYNMRGLLETWDGFTAILKVGGVTVETLTSTGTSVLPAVGIKSHTIDLTELSIQKRLTDIWIDYEINDANTEIQLVVVGQGTAFRDLDGLTYEEGELEKIYYTNKDVTKDNDFPIVYAKRIKLRLPVPVDKMKKYTTIRFALSSNKSQIKIYGLELHFDPEKTDNISYE